MLDEDTLADMDGLFNKWHLMRSRLMTYDASAKGYAVSLFITIPFPRGEKEW